MLNTHLILCVFLRVLCASAVKGIPRYGIIIKPVAIQPVTHPQENIASERASYITDTSIAIDGGFIKGLY